MSREPVLTTPHANARAAILAGPKTVSWPRELAGLGDVWDYSFARPTLQGAPIMGVCRYLDYLPNSKVVQAAELKYIMGCGKVVLFNWENGAQDMLKGEPEGSAHAFEANRQLDSLGIGSEYPIIYSADWDAQPSQYAAIASYLDAAAKQGRPVGIYGKNAMVHWMLANGHATIGWVTLAWLSGQTVSPLAHLFQDGVNSPNGTDHNIILKPYWGYYPTTGGTDEMNPDQDKALKEIHAAIFDSVDNSNADNLSGSGIPWAVNQLLTRMTALEAQVSTLASSASSGQVPPTMSVNDIAAAVVAALKANPLHP